MQRQFSTEIRRALESSLRSTSIGTMVKEPFLGHQFRLTCLNRRVSFRRVVIAVVVTTPCLASPFLSLLLHPSRPESPATLQQAANECNYHYFYQLLLGKPAGELKKAHLLPDPNQYTYLRSSTGKATERRGLDKAGFEETMKVMTSISVSSAMQEAVVHTLAGLLRLGNIELGENTNGDSFVQSVDDLQKTSELLGANQALLQQALCSRTMKLKTGEMQIPLKPIEARSSRDALAKNLYLKLFGWMVSQVNSSLIDPAVKTSQHNFLGILDIYGFENFERNSLEQVCSLTE